MPREDLRKLVHVAFALGAFAIPWIGRGGGLALAVAGLAHNLWLLPRYGFGRRLHRETPDRGRAGLILYPLAVALLFAAAPLPIAAATWVIIGVGDGFASIVGRRARRTLPWNRRKTWAGSFAFALAATAPAALVLLLVDPTRAVPHAFLTAAIGSVMGAIIETVPWRIDDNLAVAVAAAAAMWRV
ncbi:MAG: hypothetical protein U1E76_05975 [Planctomycetota bacterium]